MSIGYTSSLEWALKLGVAGHKVLYVESGKVIADLVGSVDASSREITNVVRANGRQRISTVNGGEVVFISTDAAGRGHSADALFVPDRIRNDPDAMADLLPVLNTSELGHIYALFERVY